MILFRDVIIPQARQTVEVSESSYRTGKVDFLTLVDNWRKLLDFQLLYEQSLATLVQSFADLQQAVGRDQERRPAAHQTLPQSHPDGAAGGGPMEH